MSRSWAWDDSPREYSKVGEQRQSGLLFGEEEKFTLLCGRFVQWPSKFCSPFPNIVFFSVALYQMDTWYKYKGFRKQCKQSKKNSLCLRWPPKLQRAPHYYISASWYLCCPLLVSLLFQVKLSLLIHIWWWLNRNVCCLWVKTWNSTKVF